MSQKIKERSSVVPRHIAIIPDGNRRWAKEQGLAASMGHRKAIESVRIKSMYQAARDKGVQCITLWGFSTENWKRSNAEKKVLFEIFEQIIDSLRKDLMVDLVRFIHIGRRDRLPKSLMEKLRDLEEKTKGFDSFTICLALDYGGRDELLRATAKLLESGKEVTEESFGEALDSSELPELDLIIRTSGEQRLSGFMPFQSVYSELVFVDKYFPDFSVQDLLGCIESFAGRGRRFGK